MSVYLLLIQNFISCLFKPVQKIIRVEVIRRVSAALAGTLFLLLTVFLIPSNSDSVDLSFALLYNGYTNVFISYYRRHIDFDLH